MAHDTNLGRKRFLSQITTGNFALVPDRKRHRMNSGWDSSTHHSAESQHRERRPPSTPPYSTLFALIPGAQNQVSLAEPKTSYKVISL